MNRLSAQIVDIEFDNSLAIITLEANNIRIKSIIIGDKSTEKPYKIGDQLTAIVKETEVVITKNLNLSISLQNRIPGTITSIEINKLLSRINIDTPIGHLTSVITSKAVEELKLSKEDEILALIKTNEIMLSSR